MLNQRTQLVSSLTRLDLFKKGKKLIQTLKTWDHSYSYTSPYGECSLVRPPRALGLPMGRAFDHIGREHNCLNKFPYLGVFLVTISFSFHIPLWSLTNLPNFSLFILSAFTRCISDLITATFVVIHYLNFSHNQYYLFFNKWAIPGLCLFNTVDNKQVNKCSI